MILDRFAKKLEARAYAQKKVSKPDWICLGKIIDFINYVNSLDEGCYQVFEGRLIDDILIPKEFADFIIPKSVRLIPGDRKFTDLLVRGNVKECPVTYDQLMNAYDTFRGNFKRDSFVDMITIGSLRVDKSLNEVISNICLDDVCHVDGLGIPIEVKADINVIEKRYFNQSLEDVVDDYLHNLKFI